MQVESDVVVPVELASGKKEYAAHTLRPRLLRHLDRFLVALPETKLEQSSLELDVPGKDLSNIGALLQKLRLEQQMLPAKLFKGGASEAKGVLHAFLERDFGAYADTRNQLQTSHVSHMSKYLHFGQISPLYVALEVQAAGAEHINTETYNTDSYLEELIVRRELPMNYVFYEPTTTNTARCPSGRGERWPNTGTTPATPPTRARSSRLPRRTTPTGTPPCGE